MKKLSLPKNKKLSLSKETIRPLSAEELKAAAGASGQCHPDWYTNTCNC